MQWSEGTIECRGGQCSDTGRPRGGQAAVLEQDEICTAPITSALEGRRVDNWVEGRARGENRRRAITGPN